MFDPESEEFTEYENDQWDLKRASMIWGIFYTQDDEIWFTDDAHGSLWKFSIPEKRCDVTDSAFSVTEEVIYERGGNERERKRKFYPGRKRKTN